MLVALEVTQAIEAYEAERHVLLEGLRNVEVIFLYLVKDFVLLLSYHLRSQVFFSQN